MNLEEIISISKEKDFKDIELITKSYHFAVQAHKDQKRKSGEPYMVHPFETAKNLAIIGVDSSSIAAGLLHDVLEDTEVDEKIIKKEFGKEILFLIKGVTKLRDFRHDGDDAYLENLRTLFAAISEDPRVLIIKLTDRLHNMRTLGYLSKEKQIRIAKETLNIYVPLADRLGIWRLARELENLSFKFLHPKKYDEVSLLLAKTIDLKKKEIDRVNDDINNELSEKSVTVLNIENRVKNVYSVYCRLDNEGKKIEEINDLAVIIITVLNNEDCYRVFGIIHGKFRPLPENIDDFIAVPKTNGYMGLHTTVFTGTGGTVEIQILTEKMRYDAEYGLVKMLSKKKYGEKFLDRFKSRIQKVIFRTAKKNTKEIVGEIYKPKWIKQIAESNICEGSVADFIKNLIDDTVNKRICVFTPAGDSIDLPVDSTPVDFAYTLHYDLGDHISGAKVNNKKVPLDTRLESDDIVEVITDLVGHHSVEILKSVKTALAKKRIRMILKM